MKPTETASSLRAAITAHRAGDLSHARELYEAALLHDPTSPEILFNFGLLLLRLRDFTAAADCFEKLLKVVPDHSLAQYHLANSYFSLEKFNEAKALYEEIILKNPGHLDALNNLGALLLHEKETEHALQCFSAILSTHPDHEEARNNIAATLLQLQQYAHAAEHYRLLLDTKPDDLNTRYSYALALLDSNQFTESIAQFQQILTSQPHHLDALNNLGIAYLKSGDKTLAKKTFAQALSHQPENPTIDYLYRALTGETPPTAAPTAYVKDLFEHYAKHYEPHVVDTLHYTVPTQLRALLQQHYPHIPKNTWWIADLGCGTGLSGLPFQDIAHHLTGIDISPRMLQLAKHKNIYHTLIEGDLLTALQQLHGPYDLFMAADTFNYFGDFASLFTACYDSLRPEGYLLFSAETNPTSQAWALQAHARYAHSQKYIITTAQETKFNVIAMQAATLREQAGAAVNGWLVLLQKRNETS